MRDAFALSFNLDVWLPRNACSSSGMPAVALRGHPSRRTATLIWGLQQRVSAWSPRRHQID
eukprot:14807039-Alexandrium_andersonii.AAC.1